MGQSDGLLELIRKCNAFVFSDSLPKCARFFVDGKQVGIIRPDILKHLEKYPDVFVVKKPSDTGKQQQHVYLADSLKTAEERTKSVGTILQKLRCEDALISLRGWRDETYDVKAKFSDSPLMVMERAATCLFGLVQYGTHVNAYTKDNDGNVMMWLARRSPTKPTFPDKLDNMCAGGLSSGLGVLECMEKECEEEASVPPDCLQKLRAAGTVSYIYEDERGVFPETQFIFDLEVPSDFKPVNADGEVADFKLVTIDEVKELIVTDDFKFNCALVILDFLVRHGFITPDNEPNYTFLVEYMHYPLQTLFDKN